MLDLEFGQRHLAGIFHGLRGRRRHCPTPTAAGSTRPFDLTVASDRRSLGGPAGAGLSELAERVRKLLHAFRRPKARVRSAKKPIAPAALHPRLRRRIVSSQFERARPSCLLGLTDEISARTPP